MRAAKEEGFGSVGDVAHIAEEGRLGAVTLEPLEMQIRERSLDATELGVVAVLEQRVELLEDGQL